MDQLWSLVVGAVVQLDGVTGTRPRGHSVVAPYVRAAQRAAREDVHVARALMRVVNLLAPPESLMAPATALRVARAAVGRHVVYAPQQQPKAAVPA
ncbi:MAG TPA: hypothetical protein VIR15_10780 [Intrasporangium sp.]|uniref:hypothetical protein n=1 Tax=Intrasporangium sp. TaxID=1925024 RepID=UPI002F95C326